MQAYLRCLRAEREKLRGSAIWAIFLLVPLISAAYGTFNYLQNLGILREDWYSLYTQHTLFYALFFFAPLVGLYGAYLWRLEHLGGNWNRLLSAPVPYSALYGAKFVTVLGMALCTQLWVALLYTVCGKVFAHLPGWPPVEVIVRLLRGALASTAVIALQLLLSLCIRSFALPVLIALAGGVASVAIGSEVGSCLWPYALMMMGMNANRAEDMLAGHGGFFTLMCVLYTLLFSALAVAYLRFRDART